MAASIAKANTPQASDVTDHLSVTSNRPTSLISVSNISIHKVGLVDEDDLYSADDIIEKKEKSLPDIPSEGKKKKGNLEDAPEEELGPPPYSPPIAAAVDVRKPLWKRRWILLCAAALMCVLIIALAVSLGVVLSRKAKPKESGSDSNTSGGSGSGSPTTVSPSSPTATVHSGNASPPLRNTAISAITIPGLHFNDVPLVQIFFQDNEYYLCSKTSTSSVEVWPASNSGSRILPALNSTPISVVRGMQPGWNYLPIRVFFVNTQGYLADIYQSTWGGLWVNGSLSDRQFRVGRQDFGYGSNSIAAAWCDFATVYAQGTDETLYAFQLTGDDREGNGGTWEIVWKLNGVGDITATNIASTCVWTSPSTLFVNSFGGLDDTGKLVTWYNSTNVTIPFPASVANLYRPDTPIATVYHASDAQLILYLVFPLPISLSSLSPNPSLHYLTAEPYWSSKELMPGCDDCWVATEGRLNWTDTTLIDTGIVPYARGATTLFTGSDVSPDNGVVDSMPRSWTPLLLDTGRLSVVYLDDDMAIRVADVVGGTGRYIIIDGAD